METLKFDELDLSPEILRRGRDRPGTDRNREDGGFRDTDP